MESDEAERRRALAGEPAPGTVALERPAPGAAIVTLRGEHDLSTRAEISDALARVGNEAHVLVDLSECSFIDSSVIGVLVVAFQALDEQGRRLELAIPSAAARDPARREGRRPDDVPRDPRDAQRRLDEHLRDLSGRAGPCQVLQSPA